MKPVLPKLQEFGEDREEPADRVGATAISTQRTTKRGRPFCPPKSKLGTNRPEAAAQFSERVLPSYINVDTRELRLSQSAEDVAKARKVQAQMALKELKQMQSMWESQSKAQSQLDQLGQFTLVGKGAPILMHSNRRLTVLDIKDIEEDLIGLPMDGNAEWTAVTMELPQESSDSHLACLLLCRGVQKSLLPRVKISDWKPGSIGVPTFHCTKCMKRWLKLGKIPESCSQDEDFAEGPAMCITHRSDSQDGAGSKMIVGGALGMDGKPVRIKVELPTNLQRMLKSDRKKNKKKRTEREGDKRGKGRATEIDGQTLDGNIGDEIEDAIDSSDEEGDEILDIPDSFKKYILKKALRERNSSKLQQYMSVLSGKNGNERALRAIKSSKTSTTKLDRSNLSSDWSMSDFTTSSLSSLSSKVDSEEFLKYLEYGESGDEFLSDEYSLTSQLDIVGGENVSKPHKKYQSSKEDLTGGRPASFDSSMKRLCSSGNREFSSLTKAQSRVLNDEGMDMKRSRSFPDPNSLHSSSTHLPPIYGKRSSQSKSKHSIRRLPQGKLSDSTHLLTKTSEEAMGLGVIQGHSFTSMVPKINSFVEDYGSDSARRIVKDKGQNKRKNDRERRQSQNENMSQNMSDENLHLPNIFDGSPGHVNHTVNSTNTTGAKYSGGQGSGQHERPSSRASQSIHLPQLRMEKGAINGGDISQNHSTATNKFWQKIDRNHTPTSPINASMSSAPSHTQGIHTIAMDTGMPHEQSMHNSNMTQSTNAVSSAVGSRRGSIQTPTFPAEISKKRRTSKVSQAVVREDVELPVGRSNKNRFRPPPRQRTKRSEDVPLLQKLSENNLNKTLSAQLPEMPDLARRQSMEMTSFHTDDNIPRRIGHKLVKKKKGEEASREAAMHNSKDIGNIVEGTDGTMNSNVDANGLNSLSRRPSAFLAIEENTIAQSPLSSSLKANQNLSSNFGYNSMSSVATGAGGKSRPVSGGMGAKMSSKYEPNSSQLLQENKNSTSPMLPPVRLKPLDPSQTVDMDLATTNGLPAASVPGDIEQRKDGEKVTVMLGANPATADEEEKAEAGEEEDGLEAIMEESEPESDDDDEYFDIHPISELKPVSTLSFSSNNFSYFPIGRAHKQAYQAVHQKASAPAPTKKWGRSHRTPAKITKRRKR